MDVGCKQPWGKSHDSLNLILKHFLIWASYQEKEMLIDKAKMAKIHKFGLANSLVDSPMATWLTLTGTLSMMSIDVDNSIQYRIVMHGVPGHHSTDAPAIANLVSSLPWTVGNGYKRRMKDYTAKKNAVNLPKQLWTEVGRTQEPHQYYEVTEQWW